MITLEKYKDVKMVFGELMKNLKEIEMKYYPDKN